ncbi:hypothetical protein ACLOJK_015144, partial [Asimina triloba]
MDLLINRRQSWVPDGSLFGEDGAPKLGAPVLSSWGDGKGILGEISRAIQPLIKCLEVEDRSKWITHILNFSDLEQRIFVEGDLILS